MSVFKCKMCGGTIEFEEGATVGVCDSCGTKQTLPRLDDDRRANLYDRANHFRRNNDFDKAMGIYEQILNEDSTDAEAYWSIVLCHYGIEYVEDPHSHKRIPTVNRAQFTSVFDDDNYKSALHYADTAQREVYEEEAKAINEIQKGILAISQKEEPFDVFICYKETDNNGRRTPDSVLANDLYHQLTQEGFKVFFSRITLEDKLGTAYEPYIFAALNSAKVMVVLGTKPEYFNAVWVKNEWSRYLALVKNSGGKKMLIPAYKDMDPYDLPEEFSHLQAQDMGKLGFMQDLIRGIKKIVEAENSKTAPVKETMISNVNSDIAPLLKRVFIFLEDGDWDSANEYCEKVLDRDPECAEAYLGKLMAELQVKKQRDLNSCAKPFDNSSNYKKALRFADDELKERLCGYISYINERNENNRLQDIYNKGNAAMHYAKTEDQYRKAAVFFESVKDYKDSAELAKECREKAETARKDAILAEGKAKMTGEKISNYEEAISLFESVPGWEDADEQVYVCKRKIEEIKLEAKRKAEEERIAMEIQAWKTKRALAIGTLILCVCIAFVILLTKVIIPNGKYNNAMALIDSGKYTEAISAFEALDGYKDSTEKARALTIKVAKVGDYVKFGSYEQDNDTSNGNEEIEWLVLEKEDDKMLVISKYALDCKPYNTEKTGVTWETCTLRKWLNENFINAAFSDDEKAMIPTVTVSADKNPSYSTDPGNATEDKVFFLSITEANNYFASPKDRKCVPTAYAVAQGVSTDRYIKDGAATCWWWLRSPGNSSSRAAGTRGGGGVDENGRYVVNLGDAVRPAMWIDLNA